MHIILKFFLGLTRAFSFVPPRSVRNPFAYADKAITYDWESVGNDIKIAANKLDKKEKNV